MDNTLAALKTAADRKAKADLAAAAAAQQLHATIKAAILDPEVQTATILEMTGLSTARIYQINARD